MKKENRQLNEKEIEISKRNINNLEERNKRLEYFVELIKIDIQKIKMKIQYNFPELYMQLEELNKELENIQNERDQNDKTIQITKKQIEEGVKPKYLG